MDIRPSVLRGPRRRLIDLGFRPGMQIKLPAILLLVTTGFAALFLAHTRKAWGSLVEIGLADPWLRVFAREIQQDYFVVSLAIACAYAVVIVGICLAGTHRIFGPIVALERHLESLKRGDYTSRVRLRSGHPLCGLASDLNELGEVLARSRDGEAAESAEPREASGAPVTQQASKAVERLLRLYSSDAGEDAGPEELEEPDCVALAGQAG